MITIESVSRTYGDFTAVDDVSFTAQPGRVTGFLGPNGAGKSTTMRIIVGLTAATSGTATVAGRRYVDLPNPGLEVGVLLDASAQHRP
jgi:ABC-2 type transport system ATP-binding protein